MPGSAPRARGDAEKNFGHGLLYYFVLEKAGLWRLTRGGAGVRRYRDYCSTSGLSLTWFYSEESICRGASRRSGRSGRSGLRRSGFKRSAPSRTVVQWISREILERPAKGKTVPAKKTAYHAAYATFEERRWDVLLHAGFKR